LEGEIHLERRSADRTDVQLDAGIRQSGASGRSVRVLNLSAAGCAFEPAGLLRQDQLIWVRLPGLESWAGKVTWVKDGRAGCEFERKLHPAVLDRLLGQS
jgi:hypothetical protein